jgi:hypothetical protein
LCTLHNAQAKTSYPLLRNHAAPQPYIQRRMELALTLVAMASFFALILAWIVLPASETQRSEAVQPLTQPQIAA